MNELTKKQFKEKFGYSESTYQRRMKEFKESNFSNGYINPTPKEIWIDEMIYRNF